MRLSFKSRSPRHRATRAGMSHTLKADWLAEADRRINPDHDICEWFGYTAADWDSFSVLYKVDRREEFFSVKGMAS